MQKDIQDAQLEDANEARKLQLYQAEVGTYSAELNKNVQVFTQELTKIELHLIQVCKNIHQKLEK